MLKSVRIQNFRQFEDLTLDNLAQINLITGQNDTGKTSLLEAIWLYQAGPVNPAVIQLAAQVRGIDQMSVEGPAAWGWIFGDHKAHDGINVDAEDRDGQTQSLSIAMSSAVRADPTGRTGNGSAVAEQVVSTASVVARSLQLQSVDVAGVVHHASLEVIGESAVPYPATDMAGRRWYFLAHRTGSPSEEAKELDQLVLAGHEREILEAFRAIDDRVVGVRTFDPGTGHRIYVQMKDGRSLPMSVMGDGFHRAGKIATAIVKASGGIALIDEINDGLHYSVLVAVWKSIIRLAKRYSVQVFATTHSLESINAAVEGSEGHEGSLAFYRLERRGDDIAVVQGEDFRLRAAVSVGTELR